jgi:phosphoserine aminotransferase
MDGMTCAIGIRTSLYNAVTLEQVESVSIFMKEFRLIEQNK